LDYTKTIELEVFNQDIIKENMDIVFVLHGGGNNEVFCGTVASVSLDNVVVKYKKDASFTVIESSLNRIASIKTVKNGIMIKAMAPAWPEPPHLAAR
jgi:hypothetical protein